VTPPPRPVVPIELKPPAPTSALRCVALEIAGHAAREQVIRRLLLPSLHYSHRFLLLNVDHSWSACTRVALLPESCSISIPFRKGIE
jgi:hypothetical protein